MKGTVYDCNVRTCRVAAELLDYQIMLRVAVFLTQSGEEHSPNVRIASDKLLNRFAGPLDHVWIVARLGTGAKASEQAGICLNTETGLAA
jgi:hypothetical protein